MQFADRPQRFDQPQHDMIIPGRVHDPQGGVILDTELQGLTGVIRVWLSYAGLHQIARKFPQLDLVEASERDVLQLEVHALTEQNAALADRLEAAEAKLERINGVAKDGYKVVRRPPTRSKTKAGV